MGMVMGWIFAVMLGLSVISAIWMGNGSALAAAVAQGAQDGIMLVISMAGAICLWCGVGKLMEASGVTGYLSRILRPVLHKLFPTSQKDQPLANSLSANICANLMGLGNAATPMGLQAVKRFSSHSEKGIASDEMCRLIVLNTASIQLIPATVAAVRSSAGSATPFDILPAVWVTSLCSATAGLLAAYLLGKVWKK